MNRKERAQKRRNALYAEYRKVMQLRVDEQTNGDGKVDLVDAYEHLCLYVQNKGKQKPQEKAFYYECLRTFTKKLTELVKEGTEHACEEAEVAAD